MHGALAQEEELCRKSSLGVILYKNRKKYPIRDGEMMVSKDVMFFRDDNYCFTDPFRASVGTLAAYNTYSDDWPGFASEEDGGGQGGPLHEKGMKDKIRLFLTAALKNGNDSVLLSAFGCGAFGNDPKYVAKWMKEVIEEPRFSKKFREIRIAIIPPKNFRDQNNIKCFREVFETQE